MTTSTPSAFAFEEKPGLLSPRKMLELPRPGPGAVNPAGDLVLVSVAQWSFDTRKYTRWLSIVPIDGDVPPLHITLVQPADAFWLDARTIALVRTEDGADTQSLFALALTLGKALESGPEVTIGVLAAADGRDFVYSADAGRLVFAADVYADTDLATVAAQDAAYSARGDSALVYDGSFMRHWDTWTGPKRTALFAVALARAGSTGAWALGASYVSPMNGTAHASPVYPFGGTDDFGVSATHVVYASRVPELPKTFHTRRDIYIAPLDGSAAPRALTAGTQGETHAPAFSPCGGRVAWLQMDEDTNDADKLHVVVYDLAKEVRFHVAQNWDRSPDSLAWTPDGQTLLLTAHDLGRAKVFSLPVPATPSDMDAAVPAEPTMLTSAGVALAPHGLRDSRVVFSRNSTLAPTDVFVLDPAARAERRLTAFADAALRGVALPAVSEMWFEGAEGRTVHSWVVLPPGFEQGEEKKWPVIMLVHGGAQAAWNDQWSTRFNVAAWASQGYVIFIPNFTGSTGFGQAFVDAVARDWGGAPFVDMRAGWRALLDRYPEIDAGRAGALGGSWGGYGVNLIQGHPEWNFGFRALVCHCGEFDSTYSGYSMDEQTIFWHEWGGRPWEPAVRERTDRMSPHKFVAKWGTPQLWLHGSHDFRVSETQAIAAFHALQQHDVPGRLVVFPDENHFVVKPGNSMKWHWEVFRFLDEYVKKA